MAMRDRGGDGAEKGATPPDIKAVTAINTLSGLSCIFRGDLFVGIWERFEPYLCVNQDVASLCMVPRPQPR